MVNRLAHFHLPSARCSHCCVVSYTLYMKCPKCGRPGKRVFKGYCTKTHYKLEHKKARKKFLPCAECGAIILRNPSQIARSGNVFCKTCKNNKGENHYKWKDGQFVNEGGYRLILVNGSYLREHRVVWENANHATLLPGMQGSIHHVNFDKLDNSPDNLLLLSNEEHGRFHRLYDTGRRREAGDILRSAAERQSHHPREVASFIATRCS